jgi:hypothetical protein
VQVNGFQGRSHRRRQKEEGRKKKEEGRGKKEDGTEVGGQKKAAMVV